MYLITTYYLFIPSTTILLLSPPFYHFTQPLLFTLTRMQGGIVVFPEARWASVTQEAKNLVSCMLEVSPKTRPTAAMVLEDTWLCAIEETPSTKIRDRIMNRERTLNGEVQIKGGRRRHSSSWSNTESGHMGRRKSKESMDNLLYLKQSALKVSTYGVDSTGPTPALTPTLSLTSVRKIESVENSKRILSQQSGQDMNSSQQSSKSDPDYDIDSHSISHSDDHADADVDADSDAGSDPGPAPAPTPHQSSPTTTTAALSAVTSEKNATNDHHSGASIPLTNTAKTALGLDMGVGQGSGVGSGSRETIEGMEGITKDENDNKNENEENVDMTTSYSTTTSTLYTTSSTLFIRNVLSSPYNDVMSLHALATSFPDHDHDHDNAISDTLSGAERSSSTGNVPRCFDDLAVVVTTDKDKDEDKDIDAGRDRDRETEGDGGRDRDGGGGGEGNGMSSQSHVNKGIQSGRDRKKYRQGDIDGGNEGDEDKIVTKEIVMGYVKLHRHDYIDFILFCFILFNMI